MKQANNIVRFQPYIELQHEDVNERAFRLWRLAGRPSGRALSYWLQAEVELLTERLEQRTVQEPLADAA